MVKLRAKAKSNSHALQKAGIPHAVVGGLSVAAHVASVDESAVRNTRDLDILLNRRDLNRAAEALKPLGYQHRKGMGISAFLLSLESGRRSRFGEGVHVVFAGERVRPEHVCPASALTEDAAVLTPEGYACLSVRDLACMKLTGFRLKDQVHIQDLLEAKLITRKIKESLPPELRTRLKQIEAATERERLG